MVVVTFINIAISLVLLNLPKRNIDMNVIVFYVIPSKDM